MGLTASYEQERYHRQVAGDGVRRLTLNGLLCLTEGAFPICKTRPLFQKEGMMLASFFDLFYQIIENDVVKRQKNIPVDFSKETLGLVVSFH